MGIFRKIKGLLNSKDKDSHQGDSNLGLKNPYALYDDTSAIPESEKKYYQPDDYYVSVLHPGTPFAFTVIPFVDRIKSSYPSKNGLYVPEILMLTFCKNFPNPKRGYPAYWWFQYGIRNVGAMLLSLKKRGFIEINSRTGKYELTDLGNQEQRENEYVSYTHRHSQLAGFTPWEMNQLIHENPQKPWIDIFCEKTGEPHPLDKSEIIKTNLKEPMKPLKPRIPVDQIKNLDNWNQGFKEGYPHYKIGEQYRKAGDLYGAINEYDTARALGYNAPALYNSYAMVFRKFKDYQDEVDILEEGIARNKQEEGFPQDGLCARLARVRELLEKEQAK